jgi:amino acid permease
MATTKHARTETSPLLPERKEVTQPRGSSLAGCIFNFTNSIVGAGCIGLAGAIAKSGGIISILSILVFAILSKCSIDILIELSEGGSYEQLASQTYGRYGSIAVSWSRFLYSFGCLVAYVKIVHDNFASAVQEMTGKDLNDGMVTFLLSATVILPLSLMRDMTPLERVSIVKIIVVISILGTVLFLYPANHVSEGSYQKHWFEIRPGFVGSLGTFVFTCVAHHVVHLTYESLRPNLRTVPNWKRVSTLSVALSTLLSCGIGISVYVTFWEQASSNMFDLYPPSTPLNIAKLLLSFMMMFTYPVPFLACRELMIISIPFVGEKWWLLEPKQLIVPFHVLVTVLLWGTSTILALLAPSLGDVLDLVGCATGTMIAFILPAMFSFRLKGYTHLAGLIFVVGGTTGIVGTIQSLQTLIQDSTIAR